MVKKSKKHNKEDKDQFIKNMISFDKGFFIVFSIILLVEVAVYLIKIITE